MLRFTCAFYTDNVCTIRQLIDAVLKRRRGPCKCTLYRLKPIPLSYTLQQIPCPHTIAGMPLMYRIDNSSRTFSNNTEEKHNTGAKRLSKRLLLLRMDSSSRKVKDCSLVKRFIKKKAAVTTGRFSFIDCARESALHLVPKVPFTLFQ